MGFFSNLLARLVSAGNPTCTLTLQNDTPNSLTYVETSPRDPQHVTVAPGSVGTLTITDNTPGSIHVAACTGFVKALICSSGNYVISGNTLNSQFNITNGESTDAWCIIASGGHIEADVIPGRGPGGTVETGEIFMPATGFCKMILCDASEPRIHSISPAIAWDGTSSIARTVTATATVMGADPGVTLSVSGS